MKGFIQKLWGSEYFKNVLTLSSGTTVAQIISIGTAPILYRIYAREDYGTLGLYMAIVSVVGVFSTLQLTQSILLEDDENQAREAFQVTYWVNILFSIGVLILCGVFYFYRPPMVEKYYLWPWIMLLPASVFFTGQNQILRVWANRIKEFKMLMRNSLWTAILVPLFSITIGLFWAGPLGLFVGLLIGQSIPPLLMSFQLSRPWNLYQNIFRGFRNSRNVLSKHYRFPKFSLPSELLSTLSHQMPVFMLGTFSGVGTVGVYNLAVRMLGMPSVLISSAVGEVYKQKAVEENRKTGRMKNVFMQTAKSMGIIGIVVFGVVMLIGPGLFSWVFGSEWTDAGYVARILAVMFLLRFVNSPLSYVIYIKNKHYVDLVAGIWFLISSTLVLYLGFSWGYDYMQVLTYFVINFVVFYTALFIYNYKLSV